jgi:hypothetical protein
MLGLVVGFAVLASVHVATAAPPPDFGACIVPGNGNCVEISELLCILINGTYGGDGSTCPLAPPEPKLNAEVAVATSGDCDVDADAESDTEDCDEPVESEGSESEGSEPGTDEAPVNPLQGPPGACIVPGNGNCVEVSELLCILINGEFHGVGSTCPVPPPEPK